jgi:membrane protein
MRQRVTALITWGRSLFPVRVWLHLLDQNGLLLAAGMSYQSLFAIFAAVYVGFSIAGIWLLGRPETLNSLVDIVNTAVPGLIGDDGILTVDQLTSSAALPTGVLTWTGVIALGGLVWTAIGWITFSRMAVRQVLGLEKDKRSYVLMKARDLLVAVVLGALLLVAAAMSVLSTAALDWLFGIVGWSTASPWYTLLARGSGLVIVFAIDTIVLAALFRFLSRAAIQWRRLWGGSLLGGAAMLVLQLLSSLLVTSAARNPLLATFAVFVGLLLFFRLTSIVTLTAAAWIAVGAADRREPLQRMTDEQRQRALREAERAQQLAAARVRVRDAREAYADAGWWGRPIAASRLRAAERELADLAVPSRDQRPEQSEGDASATPTRGGARRSR